MTLHRLGAGTGYRYLTDQVASHDGEREPGQRLTDYYQQSGNPAGRWMGTGAAVLGVEGAVSTRQMHNLYGLGLHPTTGVQLGRRFQVFRTVEERVRDREEAARDAGTPLTEPQLARVELEEVVKGERQAVSGFDCVFSPVKSVSLAWGLSEDPEVVRQLEDAHHAAVEHTVGWLERDVVFARTGAAGVAQVDVSGVAVAAFDHRTSRAGDPDLHTHAVISNKVLARLPDGGTRWLTLDSQALHKAAVAASERYNRTLEDEVSRRLGWTFAVREDQDKDSPTAIREIAGVPLAAVKGFSARRRAIESGYASLVARYHAEHGHTPPKEVQYALAQQATLANRQPKELTETIGQERARWAEQATRILGEPDAVALRGVLTRQPLLGVLRSADFTDEHLTAYADAALDDVAARRSTWTVRHVQAAAQRATRDAVMASPKARDAVVARVVARVLERTEGPDAVVRLDPPELVAVPAELQRQHGESVFVAHASQRYTTRRQLEAEDELLAHVRDGSAPAITVGAVEAAADARDGRALAPDQLDAVRQLGVSGRRVGLLVGPAGTGKTTTMRTLVDAWRLGTGGRVWGLAPTAVAAAILEGETGLDGSSTMALQAMGGGDVAIGHGDLVIVDEAGMAGTAALLGVVRTASEAGAKVVLVGDHRQLGAIESGGALRLIASDEPGATAELTSVWRFADVAADGTRTVRAWEADASLLLRRGDARALEAYIDHGRVAHGAAPVLQEQLYEAWKADEDAGKTSIMVASTTDTIAGLGSRARADRVAAGQVEAGGVPLSDGNLAGVGDVVVTRRNDRRHRVGSGFVKNGDLWEVRARTPEGGLSLRHVAHPGLLVDLPPAYVAEHVEQGYAMTVHRAQGSTVDTAHVLVDGTFSRELLYVAATRGRESNRMYAVTDHLIDAEAERTPLPEKELARAVLAGVLRHETADRSATETLRESYASVDNMGTLLPRHRYAADLQATEAAGDVLAQGVPTEVAERVTASPAWPALAGRIRMLEERGVDVSRALAETLDRRGLDDAADAAAVLHFRLDPAVEASRPSGGDWFPPEREGGGPLGEYLTATRSAMADRASHLGLEAAADAPAWTRALPPLPQDAVARESWEALAGRVAAYREAFGVDGDDALGPAPREPQQAEAHALLSAAVDRAHRDPVAVVGEVAGGRDAVAARLLAARERLEIAKGDYWAHERTVGRPGRDGDDRRERVAQAEATVRRLDEADGAWHRWESATARYAEAAGEHAAAQAAAQARGRSGRDAERRAAVLATGLADARAERDAATAAWADAGRGLPPVEAWAAAREDAERTLARRGELLREASEADRAGEATSASRRTALAISYRDAQARVRELEERARAAGVDPETVRAPAPVSAGGPEDELDEERRDRGLDR